MANLIVRNLDDKLVNALKMRAAKQGISAEAEHRNILISALIKPSKKSFIEVIAAMPDVGKDSDFQRLQDDHRAADVFT
jgi:plasmid stability protein